MIAQYTELFRSCRASFSGIPLNGLKFNDQCFGSPNSSPILDPKASTSFLLHQQSIEKILELVDAVQCDGSKQIQEVRRMLVLEVQAHQGYLDRLVQEEWLHYRLKHIQIPPESEGNIPYVVQPGNTELNILLFVLIVL